MSKLEYPHVMRIWLFAGVLMVTVQILLGGITRLTGSGLSITKWEIVTGTVPPFSESEWQTEFEAYRKTPQFEKINRHMDLPQFKFIYMWEYVHRLWARLMGLVFAVPFVIFWRRGWIDRQLMRKLLTVIAIAALAASFGWIMVASGLVNRPWVNAYKLTLHLNVGLLLLSAVLWTYLSTGNLRNHAVAISPGIARMVNILLFLVVIQLILGGLMSGMKAGLFYPTWPDMQGVFLPDVITDVDNWRWENFKLYDSHIFASALVQFLHRFVAYALLACGVMLLWLNNKRESGGRLRKWSWLFFSALSVQILLGILTVINCVGTIPLWLGVLHQLGACGVLAMLVVIKFMTRTE